MKKYLLMILMLTASYNTIAQKASDILENGLHIKKGEKLFLLFDEKEKLLKFETDEKPDDFTTLEDSVFLLSTKNGINVYLKPLNPLNYSYSSLNTIIIDPIDKEATDALSSIISNFKSFNPNETKFLQSHDTIETLVTEIEKNLENNQKKEINAIFKELKALTFASESETTNKLNEIQAKIAQIETYFNNVTNNVNRLKDEIKDYKGDFKDKYIFNGILSVLSSKKNEQEKRLLNLKEIYNNVKKVKEDASATGFWAIHLAEVPATKGKISLFTVTVNQAGFKLSDEEEIIAADVTKLISKTVRVRRFQRFIPEVTAGIAYTNFSYNEYGTTSDSTGQLFVAEPVNKDIRNLNFSAMINFNYFIPNSPIHPFWQAGIGANSELPSFFAGFGIRNNINGVNRFTISTGLASTWLKQLGTLETGSKVTGTADIEKDIKYEFAWPPKTYVGIQYNF